MFLLQISKYQVECAPEAMRGMKSQPQRVVVRQECAQMYVFQGMRRAEVWLAPVAMRSANGRPSALWCVRNGRASAPPAVASSTGVSTSR